MGNLEDDISVLEWCIRLTYTGQTVDMIRYQMLKRQSELELERKLQASDDLAIQLSESDLQ